MIITSVILSTFSYGNDISDDKIEERARGLGMHYEDECKVLFDEEE